MLRLKVLLGALAVLLGALGWFAFERHKPRVPDEAVRRIPAAFRVLADVEETNPTDEWYDRLVLVHSPLGGAPDRSAVLRDVMTRFGAAGWTMETMSNGALLGSWPGRVYDFVADVPDRSAGSADERVFGRVLRENEGPLVVLSFMPNG